MEFCNGGEMMEKLRLQTRYTEVQNPHTHTHTHTRAHCCALDARVAVRACVRELCDARCIQC